MVDAPLFRSSVPPLPPAARRALFVYNACFPLVLFVLLPGLLLRMFRRGGFRENFGQRLGRYNAATHARFATGRWWWLHSISVGETGVALKLAEELHRRDPTLNIVISVTTSTGFALAQKSASDWLEVIYNPIDTPGIARAALDLIRPEHLILIEGEAWPNLLASARGRGIRIALVDARLSPRSEKRMLAARTWIAPIFNLIDRILVPEARDIERWKDLGIDSEHLAITGSIKFDTVSDAPLQRQEEFRRLLTALGVPVSAPIIVAGSTWAPEERLLAELLRDLRPEFPDLLLILVPRHIERTPQILRELESLNLRIVRRTTANSGSAATSPDLLLIDATGELREWYGLATLAIIGKSLPGVSVTGGQNPAEPAALAKATITGPHMENFAALMTLLRAHEAIAPIADRAELRQTTAELLGNPAACAAFANRARAALATHHHASSRTADLLLSLS